jgi:hypothetical protein
MFGGEHGCWWGYCSGETMLLQQLQIEDRSDVRACDGEWVAQVFPRSRIVLLFLSIFMYRETHTDSKEMLAPAGNISSSSPL